MKLHSLTISHFLFCLIAFAIFGGGCRNNQPPPKRYHLQGEVLAIDAPGKTLFVKHGDIPGYMNAMSMGYVVRDSREIAALHEGDKIQADVIVEKGLAHLENIAVTNTAPSPPAASR